MVVVGAPLPHQTGSGSPPLRRVLPRRGWGCRGSRGSLGWDGAVGWGFISPWPVIPFGANVPEDNKKQRRRLPRFYTLLSRGQLRKGLPFF